MGTQKTNDAKVFGGSSIALLQERFRELQRVKQIREEQQREVQRRRSAALPAIESSSDHQKKTMDCSLSLGLATQSNYHHDAGASNNAPGESNFWPGVGIAVSGSPKGLHGSDHVDTSLHL